MARPHHQFGNSGPVVLLVLLAAILAVSPSQAASTQPVTIEIPIFEGGEGSEFFLQCAREFEKQRPDVKVDLYGDPRIVDKVRIRILEGSFFELTNAFINYWPLIRNGDILPLDEFLDGPNWENNGTWRSSFLPGTLDLYTYKGHVYGIPLAYFVNLIWYNRGMFEEHGWKPARTWDELFDLCEKIKSAGIAPLAFQGRYPDYIQPLYGSAYYHLAGPKRYNDQRYLEPGSYANGEAEQAFALTQRLALNFFQNGAMGMSHTEAQLQFFLGKTAMIPCGAWLKSEMMGKIPDGFRLGAFRLPLPGTLPSPPVADPTAVHVFSHYYFVMAHGKHPRQAVDFLRFMTSRRMAGTYARLRDIPTVIRGTARGNLSPDMDEVVNIIESAGASYGEAPGEGYDEMNQHLVDAWYKLLTGKRTPHETAEDLEQAGAAVRNRQLNPDRIIVRHVGKSLLLLGLLGAGLVYWLITTARAIRQAHDARTAASSARAG